jgi:hypothetical protein
MARSRVVVPVLSVLIAAGAAIMLRLRGRQTGGGDSTRHTEQFRCQCGALYRVHGTGRHRVYWPEGEDASAALLSPECPRCERPLPTH